MLRRISALLLAGGLAGCGGGQPAFPAESAYDTAVIQTEINVCTTTYTVHRDGSAQRVTDTCGSGTKTTRLPSSIVAALFSDLAAAQPLNALVRCPTVDTSVTIAWNGQQSPNIGACTGSSSAEQSLSGDVSVVITSFTPLP